MALSRSYEYEIIEEDLEVEEGEEPQTTTRKVLKYDYRGAINRCRAKPENQYKRKYLTRGGNYSGFVDFNNSYI